MLSAFRSCVLSLTCARVLAGLAVLIVVAAERHFVELADVDEVKPSTYSARR